MSRFSAQRRGGFTLPDLLLVLLLVVLGGGMLLASVARSRALANRTVSLNNLKSLALASRTYADKHGGKLPPGMATLVPSGPLASGTVAHYGPCLFHLLPFLEEKTLYKASIVEVGQGRVYASWELAGKPITRFVAPGDPTADPRSDRTSYLVNGLAFPSTIARIPESFPFGLSNSIFFAEGYSRAVDLFPGGSDPTKPRTLDRRWWDNPTWSAMPTAITFQVAPPMHSASALLPQGFEPAGINVAMGDGSSRLVNPKCRATTFFAACVCDVGEILGADW